MERILIGKKYGDYNLFYQELLKYNNIKNLDEKNIKRLFKKTHDWEEMKISCYSDTKMIFNLFYYNVLVKIGIVNMNPEDIINKYPFLKVKIITYK